MILFTIDKKGYLKEHAEFENAHRGWELLWSWMEQKYLPYGPENDSIFVGAIVERRSEVYERVVRESATWKEDVYERFVKASANLKKDLYEQFIKLAYVPRVAPHHRITLQASYYKVMIKKEMIPTIIDAFKKTAADMEDPGHLLENAKKMEGVLKEEDVIGICWLSNDGNHDEWGSAGTIYDDPTPRPFNIFEDDFQQYWLVIDKSTAFKDVVVKKGKNGN